MTKSDRRRPGDLRLMNREATIDRVAERTAAAAADGAQLVVFPEALSRTPDLDRHPADLGPRHGLVPATCRERGRDSGAGDRPPQRSRVARRVARDPRPGGRTGGRSTTRSSTCRPTARSPTSIASSCPRARADGLGMGDAPRCGLSRRHSAYGGLICWENYRWRGSTCTRRTRRVARPDAGTRGRMDCGRRATSRVRTGCSSSGGTGCSTSTRSRTTSRTATGWCRPAGWRKRDPGSKWQTQSSRHRAARSWVGRHGNKRRR